MPRIFDNIDQQLLPALKETLDLADHADFCVGYLNLRGWKAIASQIEAWRGGEGECCRLLVGMHRLPEDELRLAMRLDKSDDGIDNQTALRLKKELVYEFRKQLTIGYPTREDEDGLRQLARQLRAEKVKVKLFLRHPLHAKLYLMYRSDPINPIVGYLGSSNLTMAGLSRQGELNVDVLDSDACQKLEAWFEDRWIDRWCMDISKELAEIIEGSWAREERIPPYHIYIKMAYHLSHEARAGLNEFRIPSIFEGKLFEFQTAAVKIAAHHVNRRGGVMIGDVVGLGKTLMGTALARILEDDYGMETLIICPKNLVPMWEEYRREYALRGDVLSLSRVDKELPSLRRYRLVLIDESHNLRNREGVRYRAIHEYIQQNDSKVILLSATPYNKTYVDLSNQLRLFVEEDRDLGIRPDRYIKSLGGETEFVRKHQSRPRSLPAFEQSYFIDDWRELMRLFLVRRTRSFISDNYAGTDPETGRKFLTFPDGSRSYFPVRIPKTARFAIDDNNPRDQYARLYSDPVVDTIGELKLPRYGLANYINESPPEPPTKAEQEQLEDLSRGGKRLIGFCRSNLFKRLESSGAAFIQSVERHILRNHVFLHAIKNGDSLPIGTQDTEMLDARLYDEDADALNIISNSFDDDDTAHEAGAVQIGLRTPQDFRARAAEIYHLYTTRYHGKFKWIRSNLFAGALYDDLASDAHLLMEILQSYGAWDAAADEKLNALENLLTQTHPSEKVLVFTQFADTVRYLKAELSERGVSQIEEATGDSPNPTALAWRFSPVSNNRSDRIASADELRVLISTDILSEGQNLQDCAIVVNYDLPWTIIRLVQRAGRVDRIGQVAEQILCYSFLPAEGVERLIDLRARVRVRLLQNAEVVGTDEAFFEDDDDETAIVDLYNERSGLLDDDVDDDVDLASYAYQIWKNAVTEDSSLEREISGLPDVVYSTKQHLPTVAEPEGALIYMRTGDGIDALAWVDREGNSVTESQFAILRAAACQPNTEAIPPLPEHHRLVQRGAEMMIAEAPSVGGGLGRPSGARFRTYVRLKQYADAVQGELFNTLELKRAIDDIYRFPLRQAATDALNRQLRSGIEDRMLAELVIALRDENRLCIDEGERETREPQIICSLGLSAPTP